MRRSIGVALQEAALDPLMTGRELIRLQATLHGLIGGRGRAPRRRADRTRRAQQGRRPARRHLLGRHAPPARPRLGARARAAGAVPRRADHRPRPGEPQGDLGGGRGAERARARPSSSPPSTWRRPTSSPTGSGSSAAGWIVAEGTPGVAEGRGRQAAPGDRASSTATAERAKEVAARSAACCPIGTASSWSSSSGGATDVAKVVRALDEAGIMFESLELVEPTLDDVFVAKTGEHLEGDESADPRRKRRERRVGRQRAGGRRRSGRARSSRRSAARSWPRRSSSSRRCCSRCRRAARAAPSTCPASRRSTTSSSFMLAGAMLQSLPAGRQHRRHRARRRPRDGVHRPAARRADLALRDRRSAASPAPRRSAASTALWFIAIGLIFGASFELGRPRDAADDPVHGAGGDRVRRDQRRDRALHRPAPRWCRACSR